MPPYWDQPAEWGEFGPGHKRTPFNPPNSVLKAEQLVPQFNLCYYSVILDKKLDLVREGSLPNLKKFLSAYIIVPNTIYVHAEQNVPPPI